MGKLDLSSARHKLERSKEHIHDLESALNEFLATDPYRIGVKPHPKNGAPLYFITKADDVPARVRLILGDAIHNLRSALDHIAMGLWIDGGSKGSVKTVEFPIVDCSTKYGTGAAGKIKGARPKAIELIDAIQPYRGGRGEILWQLHALNIIDKHRLLVVVGASIGRVQFQENSHLEALGVPDEQIAEFKFDLRDTKFPLKVGDPVFVNLPGTKLNEKVDFTFDITLGEPEILKAEPILGTLEEMARGVDYIIHHLEGLP